MLTWSPCHRALGQLAHRRGRPDVGSRSDASMGGVSGRIADLTQVRSTSPTWTYSRPDTGHGSRADRQSFLEDDDRPGVPFTRIQPRAVRNHGRGFPWPHQPGPSTSGYGADHNLIPTPARAYDDSPNGSPGGTIANGVASSPEQPVPLEVESPQPQVVEARAASLTPTPARSQSRSHNPIHIEPDFDTLSTDTADSPREQVRRVHQWLDEVQKEVIKSRGEVGESSKGGFPFTP
ncbi:hypothetical protein B296_00054790 [Ensete ventricosum]|uniref:Uncharacterized protein n=1 Tax=Ensete ventricosum TaxID=4639 RepID=A0A426WXE4_ENSVE|nr:hypothetical protein B296_00054790 [Ensete ventricosum]